MADYKAMAVELKGLVQKVGISKKELQELVDHGGSPQKAEEKVKEIEAALSRLKAITSQTEITEAERKRKMAEIEFDREQLQIISVSDPDFHERIRAQKELSYLTAVHAAYQAQEVLRIEQLLDDTQTELKTVLAEAAKDIAARQNLQRVMKGAEVVLRAAVFTATLVSKLAIASV
jgi:5'-3' exonuclease